MIIRIIKENNVRTQDELADFLMKYDFEVTQSSLSRDISEIGLIKQHGYYALPPRQMKGSIPLVTSVDSAGPSLIVVKTLVGMAAPVGITIDNHKIPHVVGSIAGDDTVFLAVSPAASHDIIKKALRKLFKGE
jgi:transcriptional regulator of arginine metabolism